MILLADLTPPSSRAAYMAPIGSMFALASVCGPLLGTQSGKQPLHSP